MAVLSCAPAGLVCRAPLIAFKNMPSGDVGTNPWSADGVAGEEAADAYGLHTQAKLVSTGM